MVAMVVVVYPFFYGSLISTLYPEKNARFVHPIGVQWMIQPNEGWYGVFSFLRGL